MPKIIKNFFVFEGLDGSGTTTQIKLLVKHFCATGKKVLETCEPTKLITGEFLRSCLSGNFSVDSKTMLMLFAADRNEHLFSKDGILAALETQDYVISDRYLFSSLAYQGASGHFDLAKKFNEDFPLPEILFFLDISTETAFSRVEKRANAKEIYETKLFQAKVKKMYKKVLELYNNSGMKIVVIDGNKSIEEVHKQVLNSLDRCEKL